MSYRRGKSSRSERGAALVVAMLVFALVAALIVGLQRDFAYRPCNEARISCFRSKPGLISLARRSWQRWHCRQTVAPTPEPRSPRTTWERSGRSLQHLIHWKPVAGMSGRIEDLQGRLNLNLLADSQPGGSTTPNANRGGDAEDVVEGMAAVNSAQQTATAPSDDPTKRWNATQKMFIRLLQALGEASLPLEEAMALTDAVTDFIDRDAERRLNGAEDGDYRYADYPYLPANRHWPA